jgi:hypothetical protein
MREVWILVVYCRDIMSIPLMRDRNPAIVQLQFAYIYDREVEGFQDAWLSKWAHLFRVKELPLEYY